jgi:type IV pilus assembly protein PilC
MPLFKYLVKSSDGKTMEGTMDAVNEGDVVNELRSRGFLIVEVKRAKAVTKPPSRKKVALDDLVMFTRQMATMIDAGLPLLQALRVMTEQMDNLNFRSVIGVVAEDIEGGASFSEALAKHPKAFDTLYCAMIQVGEASGMFAEILSKVATYLEEAARLRRKVKSAMIYPLVVSGMAVIITLFLLIKIVPVFEEIFQGFGADLPAPTQFVVTLSNFIRSNFLLGVLSVVGILIACRFIYKTEGGRLFFDRLQFKIPIFGDIFKKAALSRFTKTLGTLVASGVPMVQSMEIVEQVAGNATVEYALREATKKIIAGEGISTPLAEAKIFPPLVTRMIDVGERTGKLDVMLQKIADFYDDQVNNAVSALTSLIEPLLIAFLGIVVGGIVVCMFLPILKLSEIVN